ncbi:hypothetical protein LVJ83_00540 [Uruburuella testudinis]|uniref:Uncharacterized protein n=1 Tax=Uruburuella testudinis TaxID=1282863 RepID=A0ABY4DT20_9NEIS|nr:hypothetical protein [Uruburuella testudinis]UOO82001.1 hypothetical protein LVJ83_00540 [Uruburuella testudinis]
MQTMKEFYGISIDKSAEFAIVPDEYNEGAYILTIFDPDIEDNAAAFVETFECDTYEEAMEGGLEYRMHYNYMTTEDVIAAEMKRFNEASKH